MRKKLDKNILGLLLNGGIHNIITIYTGTFLVAHMLNMSEGNFFNVALYYTVSSIVLLLGYSLCSLVIAKFNKVHIIRIGIFFHCISLAILAILQDDLINYIIPIATFYSIGNAIYYSALNSLANESVKGKKITSYNTYSLIVSNITSIVVPIVFGRIIDTSSLYVISVFALILGVLQICSTFLFDKPNLTHTKLDFKGYYNECYKGNYNKTFKLFFIGYYFYGCKDAIGILVTMLIVLTFKTNTSLGMISSLIACLTILILILINKKYHSKYAYLLLVATGISALSIISLVLNINKVAIIFFNICNATILAIITRAYTIKRSGLIRAINKKQYIIEHQAVCEAILNIGRTTFYSIILFASFTSELWIYKALLMIGFAIVCLYGVYSYIIEKEYEKILIDREFKKKKYSEVEQHDLIPSYSNPNNETILR